MKAALFGTLLLTLCAFEIRADPIPPQVGPTWNILAGGVFSGYPGSAGAESFSLDLTLTFQEVELGNGEYVPTEYIPTWNGTGSFAGVLGNFTEIIAEHTAAADGGYIAFSDVYGDEIDLYVSDPIEVDAAQANLPPRVGLPYLYSCFAPAVCKAYGAPFVGSGVFSGEGEIVEQVREISAAPEPSALFLLILALPLLYARHLSARRSVSMS